MRAARTTQHEIAGHSCMKLQVAAQRQRHTKKKKQRCFATLSCAHTPVLSELRVFAQGQARLDVLLHVLSPGLLRHSSFPLQAVHTLEVRVDVAAVSSTAGNHLLLPAALRASKAEELVLGASDLLYVHSKRVHKRVHATALSHKTRRHLEVVYSGNGGVSDLRFVPRTGVDDRREFHRQAFAAAAAACDSVSSVIRALLHAAVSNLIPRRGRALGCFCFTLASSTPNCCTLRRGDAEVCSTVAHVPFQAWTERLSVGVVS